MGLGARGLSWGYGDGVVSHDAGLNSGVASLTWQDPFDGVHALFAKGVFWKKAPLSPSSFSTFSSMFTFTGGNQSMYMDRTGFLVQSQTNVPRFEYKSSTLGSNYALQSNGFDSSTWIKSGLTANPNIGISPFNDGAACALIESSGGTFHLIRQDVSGFPINTPATMSFYVKSLGRLYCRAQLSNQAENNGAFTNVSVVPDNQSVSSTTTFGSGSSASASITAVANGFYRVSITVTVDSTSSILRCQILLSNTLGNTNYSGDGVSGIAIYGLHLEPTSSAGTYIATTTSARFLNTPIIASGIIMEGARTNIALQSNALDNATWTKSNCTVTANAVNGPDGTLSADKVVEDNTTNVHGVVAGVTITAGGTYCLSAFVRAGERRFVYLYGINVDQYGAIFDLVTLASANITSGVGTVTSSGIIPYPNGYYRVWVSGVLNGAATTLNFVGGPAISTSVPAGYTYTGDNASGVYFGGIQIEAGSFPSSYMPTTGTSVTRTADFNSAVSTGFVNTALGTAVVTGDFDQGAGLDQTRKQLVNMGTTLSAALEGLPAGGSVFTAAISDGTTEFGSGVNFTPSITSIKIGSNWGSATMMAYSGGSNVNGSTAFDGLMNDGGSVSFGVRSDNTTHMWGRLFSAEYFQFKYSAATLARLTR